MNNKEQKMQDYLHKIKFKENLVLSQEDINHSFAKIKERIDLPLQVDLPPAKRLNIFLGMPFKVAASIALLLTASFFGYNYLDGQKEIIVANNTESVKLVQLPDGSKISLRSLSSIVYRKNYEKNRLVELQGEALFEVEKDKQHPFSVETKMGKITVLGTTFSVRSYSNETFTKTLLKEGSVEFAGNDKVATVILKPGEEALLNQGAKIIEVRKVVNIDRALAWQTHNFSFDNDSLSVILSVITNSFDKQLVIKDKELSKKRYTLKFNRNESLPKILDILSEVAKFKYQIENDKVIIEK
jgi:ferric-dicitrate binding protein FerR (iron transport regulator)